MRFRAMKFPDIFVRDERVLSFVFNESAAAEVYPLSLPDALPSFRRGFETRFRSFKAMRFRAMKCPDIFVRDERVLRLVYSGLGAVLG